MENHSIEELCTLIHGCVQNKKFHSHGIVAGLRAFDNTDESNVISIASAIVAASGFKTSPYNDSSVILPPVSLSPEETAIIRHMTNVIDSGINHVFFNICYAQTLPIKSKSAAEHISALLKNIGRHFSIRVTTEIQEFFEPVGNAVGQTLEMIEILQVLEQVNEKSVQLEDKSLHIAGKLLDLCYDTEGIKQDGTEAAKNLLLHKAALKKFLQSVRDKRGNPYISTKTLKNRAHTKDIISTMSGKIERINNSNLKSIVTILGAPTDTFAGVYLHKKTNDEYAEHEKMMTFYSSNEYNLKEAVETLHHFPIQF